VPLAGSDWVSHIDDPDQLDFEWTSRREAFSSATTEKEQRDIVISCFTERLACLLRKRGAWWTKKAERFCNTSRR
jgi:hypothetical protein